MFSIIRTNKIIINKTTNKARLLKFQVFKKHLNKKDYYVRNITSSIVQLFNVFENKKDILTNITNSCPIQ